MVLVLLDVSVIRIGICREWWWSPLFGDLCYGTERRFGEGKA